MNLILGLSPDERRKSFQLDPAPKSEINSRPITTTLEIMITPTTVGRKIFSFMRPGQLGGDPVAESDRGRGGGDEDESFAGEESLDGVPDGGGDVHDGEEEGHGGADALTVQASSKEEEDKNRSLRLRGQL